MKELLIAQDRYDDGFADGEAKGFADGEAKGLDYALNELSSLLATGLSAKEAIQKLKETRQK